MGSEAAQRTVEAVWRIESARLIAGLARMVRDVGLAEDLAQDALVAALVQWPSTGVPGNPGAWLTAVARRRYIDDVLRLIFTACHPSLSRDARVALTLKLVGGLSTEQIARAFLVSAPTMSTRITRAKKALADAKVPFEVPVGTELAARLASVLEVVYLIFNEGYAATEFSGPYVIQAALAACHARALVAADTDWIRIATLYSVLASLAPSPVIELNRAVAVSMADGPAAGLAIVDTLAGEPALRGYHLLPSVRGDLLERLGRCDEARAEFQRAAAMAANTSERAHLLARAAACG